MSHFAKVENGIVTNVIVATQDFFDTFVDNTPGEWVQTSYTNSNFAGVGYTYEPVRDAFYAPQPYPSWVLNEDTCLWEAPTAYPADDKMYTWNEETQSWDEE